MLEGESFGIGTQSNDLCDWTYILLRMGELPKEENMVILKDFIKKFKENRRKPDFFISELKLIDRRKNIKNLSQNIENIENFENNVNI